MGDSKKPWFRVYSGELLNERKLKHVVRETGMSKLEVYGAWSLLLCLANESPVRGMLLVTLQKRFMKHDLADELDLSLEVYEKLETALIDWDLLVYQDGTLCIKNWDKRQFESDSSTERVRKHRETHNETLPKRSSNAPDTETETDTDINVADATPAPPSKEKKHATEKHPDREELQKQFMIFTGLPAPRYGTKSEAKAAQSLWWSPLDRMIQAAGSAETARPILEKAVQRMRADRLTIASPNSVEKTFLSVVGESKTKPAERAYGEVY